jgi:hypothetical protein
MHTGSYQELLLQAKADALMSLGLRPDADAIEIMTSGAGLVWPSSASRIE